MCVCVFLSFCVLHVVFSLLETGCCIFHKKRNFDESDSDESDSDMDDEERERRWAQPKPGRPRAHQLYHG